MSIELLTVNHRERLMAAFENSKKEICIISPFLSEDNAEYFAKIVTERNVSGTFITRFDHRDFSQGANSVNGLQAMLDAKVELLAVLKLHTKLYLIDDNIAILGSANFTQSGQSHNVELSLYIENEPELLDSLHEYFEELQNICREQGKSITREMLSTEAIKIKQEQTSSKNAGPCISICPPKPFGAELKVNKDEVERDFVQEMLNPKVKYDSHVWIKFEASGKTRRDGTEYFGNDHNRTYFSPSRKPKRIQEGDTIYIAVHTKLGDGQNAPMIAARAKAHKFQETNCTEEHSQWPYYLELYDVEPLPGCLADALSLYDLVGRLGKNTYVHTQNSDAHVDPKNSHRQQAYLALAQPAAEYLEKYFNEHLTS